MLSVNLKAKHLYFICNDLRNYAAAEYFGLLGRIKTACVDVADDDEITVETSKQDLVKIFSIIAYKPEGQANRINTDMMGLLTPQIEAGVAANDAEWIDAAAQIETIRSNNWGITDNAIANGKAFVQG
jgi:hypothetical protein